jgi:hypothetical protein
MTGPGAPDPSSAFDDAPAVTVRQMVLDHQGRLVEVEGFVARAKPALWDPDSGLCPRVDVIERKQDRIDGMISLIRWTAAFAGAGTVLMVVDMIGQALGILK